MSDYQGETVAFVFRIADASDRFYDSAAFIDNLRFTNDVETDPTPARNALEQYEQSFKKHIKRKFEAQAHFIAKLYAEHGSAYSSTLTNYWGYKSGNLPKETATDGVREINDASLDTVANDGNIEVTEQDANALYQFYTDLFDELSEDAAQTELVQTTTQYFLGTHPNQDNYLAFDENRTVGEILNENWDLSTEVYERLLTETDPSQADLQRIATGLEKRSEQLLARGKKDIESKQKAAEDLISAEESKSAEVHAQKLQKAASGQAVEDEAAATTGVLLLLAVAAGGLAGGYIATKCSGAFSASQTMEGVEFSAVTLTRPDQAAIGTVNSIINLGAGIANYGQYAAETGGSDSVGSEALYTSLFTSNLAAGAKTASADLALESAVVFSKASLAQQVDAEITDLTLPDVTETEELGLLGSFISGIKGALDDLLNGWYNYSPPQVGTATGSVTVNTMNTTGDAPIQFEPVFGSDYKLYDGDDLHGTAHPFEITGDMSTMETGDQRTFDIEYKAPLDKGMLTGQGSVEFGVSPVSQLPVSGKSDLIPIGLCELDYKALHKATANGSFSVAAEATTTSIAQDTAQEGETNTFSYTPSGETNRSLLTLDYSNHYSDLHLMDSNGNEVGYDYSSNSTVEEIAGASYSGRDTGEANKEWISFPVEDEEEYTVGVVTPEVGTVGQGSAKSVESNQESPTLLSEYETSASEVSNLPPKLSVTPSTLSLTGGILPGDTLDTSLTITEVNGETIAENVAVSPSELDSATGDTIPASNIEFSSVPTTISSSTNLDLSVEVPNDAAFGTYTGTIDITASNAESVSVHTEIQVGDTNLVERTVSTTSVSPGESINTTVEATVVGDSVTISEFFEPPMTDVSVNHVLVNGTSVDPFVEAVETGGIVVTVTGLQSGDEITMDYQATVPGGQDDGVTHSIGGTYTSGDAKIQIEPSEITVESGFFEGVVASYNSDNDDDIDIGELGQAAADYADGNIGIGELGQIAQAYSNTN